MEPKNVICVSEIREGPTLRGGCRGSSESVQSPKPRKGQRGPSDEEPEMEPKLTSLRGANAALRLPRDAYIAGDIAEVMTEVEGYRDAVVVGED